MRQVLVLILLAFAVGCAPKIPRSTDVYECAGNVLVYCLPGRVMSNCEFVSTTTTTEPRSACEAP
jgi:hypothetical protein